MNMFKKAGGFTLVELIVVIAILAILAGVAVPVYSGYINSANEAADQQKIEAINTAIAAAVSMEGKQVSDAADYITVTSAANSKKVTIAANSDVTDNEVWNNFKQFYGTTSDTFDIELDYYTSAPMSAETATKGEIIGVKPN